MTAPIGVRATRGRDGGFSLLEVLVSIAILAMALVVLSRIVTGNVVAANHARMITVATFLARSHISMMEQSLLEYGFAEMDGEDEGTFAEEGFPHFRWYSNVERIELPADVTQKVQDVANQATRSDNPMEILSGFMGGFMATLMDPIRLGLQESVRKLTVRVMWDEAGKPDQSFEVVNFLTDPARLEDAVTLAATGATGTASGTATKTSTSTTPKATTPSAVKK
ncbi:MAG: type II secretion system protein [Deltaproteobacteria bacterium]|jgi:prepilin-type N-terminal cleavage/methylation domain-containing protein|nr:type II secretion system protein [Deltaproteobacteria bacterium]